MDPINGSPPGLTRSKSTFQIPPPLSLSTSLTPLPSREVLSPLPQRATTASWASSLAAGLFPTSFPVFPTPSQVPHGVQPLSEAVRSVERLRNSPIANLAVYPTPSPSDPWHTAHTRVCAHANQPCAGCSVSFVCCSCRALRFTPGTPPLAPEVSSFRSCSVSPALFRNAGNGSPPPTPHDYDPIPDDNAHTRALAECDTCDNSSCPRGADEPATYSITVEQFDEGAEESYERVFRACSACNRSCRKNFMGHRIKSCVFDNSVREALGKEKHPADSTTTTGDGAAAINLLRNPIPGSAAYARQHPADTVPTEDSTATTPGFASYAHEHHADHMSPTTLPMATVGSAHSRTASGSTGPTINDLTTITTFQDALRVLNDWPPTPAAFVATVHVKHDAMCSHSVISCPTCSLGLICCACKVLFAPAVARHLTCNTCKHVSSSCCILAYCCKCNKPWMPSDSILPVRRPARRFFGGASSRSASSPEPDIWTPSPRSSPDEIDDLTARANIPLPASRHESDNSRAPSRASSVDEPVNVAATPLSTPDYSSLSDDVVDGFIHPSFPE
ncbi:hypothetical protein AX14_005142 [Amanita brunnescens Koide BX004]|nr:hypothetical protein AX14_005142 [Amanita brunnescens Koide BX004]